MSIFRKSVKFYLALQLLFISSCSSIESTLDSTWDSISEAGDYIYDSVNFWEETEPEQSEAVIIEEAVEVPDYAMPDQTPQKFQFSLVFLSNHLCNLIMTQFTEVLDNIILWDLMVRQC